jgi:hypothetical protein
MVLFTKGKQMETSNELFNQGYEDGWKDVISEQYSADYLEILIMKYLDGTYQPFDWMRGRIAAITDRLFQLLERL